MNTDENESVNAAAATTMMRLTESYHSGTLPLSQLVNDLQSTLNGMFQAPTEWRSRFLQSWAALEEVNARALDAGHTDLPAEHEEVVIKSLETIHKLIAQARSSFAK